MPHPVNMVKTIPFFKRPDTHTAHKGLIIKICTVMLFVLCGLHVMAATGSARDTVVLGAATGLTSLEGRESLRAARLAVEQLNARGGIRMGGRALGVKLVSIDLKDDRDPLRVTDVLTRLEAFIRSHQIHGLVVGPFRSEVLLPAMDVIAKYKVPLLETIAMTPAMEAKVLADPRYRFVFRTGLNTKYLVDVLINTMTFLNRRLGYTRVYIMNQDVAWARSTASLMIKLYFNRKGWQIVGSEHIAYGTTDFSAALERAASRGAQVIVPIFDMPHSGALAQQWKQMRSPAMLCGFISPMAGPGAWKTFDGQIAGALNVIFELGNVPSDRYPQAAQFYQAYAARYGRPMESGHGPAPAYESVHVLAAAIEAAGSLDPDKIVTALKSTDRVGVMGRLRFHPSQQALFGSDPSQAAVACLIQWTRDGRRRIVYPPAVAEGEIEPPAVAP
ncbi:MAG: ABC transporter substrate-binding protein [Desulfobacteraceae bacterium]